MSVIGKNALSAAVVLLLLAGATRAQDKVIGWSAHPRGSDGTRAVPPMEMVKQIDWLEIVEIYVDGNPVRIGQPFKANSEWLKHITFKVKNNSARAITYVQLALTLPQIKGPRVVPYTIDGHGISPDTRFRPGEIVELRLISDKVFDWLKSIATEQKLDFSAIDQAEVMVVLVYVEDGTQWMSGCVKTADAWHPCPHS